MKIKKRIIFTIICFILFIPLCVAEENTIENTRYFKTVNLVLCDSKQSIIVESNTYEISENEYEEINQITNEDCNNRTSVTVETTYKKMTTTIAQNGNYYRYKNVLIWKNIPSTRSYDIIGIGHYASVKVAGNIHFVQTYKKNGITYTTNSSYEKIVSNGVGVVFKVPTGTLSSLKQELYFDVEKNVNATIIKQIAAGDYSHATTNISLNDAKKFTINTTGILLDNSIYSSYDDINTATVIWTGTW